MFNRNKNIDYTMRNQILSARVNFAYYIQQRQLIDEGRKIGINIHPPDNEVSQLNIIADGAVNTTVEEYTEYLAEIALPITAIVPTPEPSLTVPSAPTDLQVSIGNTVLSISFTQLSNGGSPITNYQYSIDNGVSFTTFSPSVITSPILISGLTNGVSYNIQLKAVNTIGTSDASATISGTPAAVPDAPTSLKALIASQSLYIYFVAAAGNGGTVTNYEYSTDGVSYTPFSPITITSPVQITGLINNTSYTIYLRAVSAAGAGLSSSVTATPRAATLISEWLYFNPNDTASYPGTGTTVSNIGSYGTFTGTMTSVTYTDLGGTIGKVFDFPGISQISFSTFNFGAQFTITAWIYARSTSTINGLIANTTANQAPRGFKFGWNTWLNNDRAMYFEGGNGTTGSAEASVVNAISYTTWQHVAYILDTIANTIYMFVNGVPVKNNVWSDFTTVNNIGTNQAFNIGAFIGGTYRMNAQLGYLKAFNTSMTVDEVVNDFNSSKSRFGY